MEEIALVRLSIEAGKGGHNLIVPWMFLVDLVLLDVVLRTMEDSSKRNVDEYARKSSMWSRRQGKWKEGA